MSNKQKLCKQMYLSDSCLKNVPDFFEVHTKISENLFDIIKDHKIIEESFTLGLFGQWGSGKSFIINKLREKVEKENNNNFAFLYIDVWKYNGFPLLRSILFDINNQLKKIAEIKNNNTFDNIDGYKDNNDKTLENILYCDEILTRESKLKGDEFIKAIKTLFKRYKYPFLILVVLLVIFIIIQFLPVEWKKHVAWLVANPILTGLTAFSAFIGAGAIFLTLLQKPIKEFADLVLFRNVVRNFTEKANFSPEQFENIFDGMIRKFPDTKIVIVFDNIDRCEPEFAYDTLSTIKTFMDKKNCFYIIPCDDEAIKKYLGNNKTETDFSREFASEFIDKLFQTYIRIPLLKEVDRDKYIKKQLSLIDISDELTNNDTDTITQILYYAYKGETPRNIKRFLNDYSSYFRLAKKCEPKLLKNIPLFTVIIAIKQKWHNFEQKLQNHPTFFMDYLQKSGEINFDNNEGLKQFLANVQTYVKSFAKESITPYIHFKESEHSLEFANILRNAESNIELNDENYKILEKEFNKNFTAKSAYAHNSLISWAKIVNENIESHYYNKLVFNFWKNIVLLKDKTDVIESYIDDLINKKIIKAIIDSLKEENVNVFRNDAENILAQYLARAIKEMKKEDVANDESLTKLTSNREYLLEIILKSNYHFAPSKINDIFEPELFPQDSLQKKYLEIIKESDKQEYLPNKILPQLLKEIENNNDEAIQTLENWGPDKLPQEIGEKLVSAFLILIKKCISIPLDNRQLRQQWPQIESLFQLLDLINISFVRQDISNDFFTNLELLINKIFQFSNNNTQYIKATEFAIKLAYFADININAIDEKLNNIFNSHISNVSLNYFIEHLSYLEDLLKLDKLKESMFAHEELHRKIYSDLEKECFTNFDLLFIHPINTNHIDILIEETGKRNINVDKDSLCEYLLNEYIKEIKDNLSNNLNEKLHYYCENFNVGKYKNIFVDNSNSFVDAYKAEPIELHPIFFTISEILTNASFNNNFILPMLKYIKSKLDATEDVSKYKEIGLLILPDKINYNLLALCSTIIKETLKQGQEVEENYLGLNLLIKLKKYFEKKDIKEFKNLIITNGNKNDWDDHFITKLENLLSKKVEEKL